MVQRRIERKLAAVFVADVAGYSRLMELDEEGTHARLNALQRELVGPKIREHQGRIIKNTGDGVLVEFASVVDAVRCAVEIQREMLERNTGLPEDRRIVFRIGINLGDVIVMPDDIYGDGVNVAARLEGLGEPGGVCISGTAYDQVRDKVPYTFAEMGEQTVKNISRPVRVYALGATAVAALPASMPPAEAPHWSWRYLRSSWPTAAGIAAVIVVAVALWSGIKPAKEPLVSRPVRQLSIIVLPFTNLNADPAQDYLGEVISDELTTALSRLRGATVIASSSALTLKNQHVDMKQLGADLDVRYALEGSVLRSDGSVRINARLIDTQTVKTLWSDQFDVNRADILRTQDEIVTRLASTLHGELVQAETQRSIATSSSGLDAEDLAMQCEAATYRLGGEIGAPNYELCERALSIDPRNVRALVQLASYYGQRVSRVQSPDPAGDLERANVLVARALEIDPGYYAAHCVKANVLEGQHRVPDGIAAAERCLALNPTYAGAYRELALLHFFLAEPEKMLEYADRGIRLSPRDPQASIFLLIKGWAYFMLEQDEEALRWLRRAAAASPETPTILAALTSELALTGHDAEASTTLARYLSLKRTSSRTIAQWNYLPDTNPAFARFDARFKSGLRRAGMPEQ
jgi:adenylate cyclase